jgi:propionyl-CoA carboxylase alpha chain
MASTPHRTTPAPPTTPIRRLLIANRGEIAVRIAATAHRMGMTTVGVHSAPDADALHVRSVDVAVSLGGATPAESYLRADALLEVALATGCDAVHPGYGFLAEQAEAAAMMIDAGVRWVGPTPEQIELLGDKMAAKRAAIAAGVPTGGFIEVEPGQVPDDVPMPALVKAAAGGGGRGMRIVRSPDELAAAIAAASREADAAFGDGTVFIEPYLERGRHVEVQILGDEHGNVIHLGDRDCSVQRRNQKVIEEAPAPGLGTDVRQQLHDGALALARHVGYRNAGTVEFMVGADGTVNFLEVNTRLQVEHPVTEAVTGLDLVELQLLVASGAPLPLRQEDVALDGHAIEVRVVAEDPGAGWLPSTGTLARVDIPSTVRCDTGVTSGSIVGADYDSLLAKVIAWAPDRDGAAATLARALRSSTVIGVRTDLAMLAATLQEPDFLSGSVDTGYLDDHPDVLAARLPDGEERVASLVAAVLADRSAARRADHHWGFAPAGWRNLAVQGQRATWRDEATGDEEHVEVCTARDGTTTILFGAPPAPDESGALGADERRRAVVDAVAHDDGTCTVAVDDRRRTVRVEALQGGQLVQGNAGTAWWRPLPRFTEHDGAAAGAGPVAPLPGVVLAVHVAEGDQIGENTPMVVLEAMKMEHVIRAATDGTVATVHVAVGDRVDAGQLLVELEAPPSP